jgi:hypothetical protein
MKSKMKSFRFSPDIARLIEVTAKTDGITQTDVISKLILNNVADSGKRIANISQMANGGNTQLDENDEVYQTLKALGIATASGFAGYYISGYIRKELEMDEDKGMQVLLGLAFGVGGLMLSLRKS